MECLITLEAGGLLVVRWRVFDTTGVGVGVIQWKALGRPFSYLLLYLLFCVMGANRTRFTLLLPYFINNMLHCTHP